MTDLFFFLLDPILSITLYIQYSHLPQLTVKQNTAQARWVSTLLTLLIVRKYLLYCKQRDYTQPLPWGQYYGYGGGYEQAPPQHDPYAAQMGAQYGGMPPQQGGGGGGGAGGGDRTAELFALARQGHYPP